MDYDTSFSILSNLRGSLHPQQFEFKVRVTDCNVQTLVFDWQNGEMSQLGWTNISDLSFVRTAVNDQAVNAVTWTPDGTGVPGSGYSQSHIPVAGPYPVSLNGGALTRVRSLWTASQSPADTKIYVVRAGGTRTLLLASGSADAIWTGSETDVAAVEIITYAQTGPKQLRVEIDIQ